jgi:hypothetical protein
MEGERVRSDALTIEDIVTNHPKLSEIKRLTHGGLRTLFIGENTSLNAGYPLLSERERRAAIPSRLRWVRADPICSKSFSLFP